MVIPIGIVGLRLYELIQEADFHVENYFCYSEFSAMFRMIPVQGSSVCTSYV